MSSKEMVESAICRSPLLHIPVLTTEVLEILQPERGGIFIDATTGTGGHTLALLERGGEKIELVFSLDKDRSSLEVARQRLQRFSKRVLFSEGDFRHLKVLATSFGLNAVDGILYDLGLSGYLLKRPERGFSFQKEGPLDMRFDQTRGPTAYQLLATLSEKELADIFYRYGEIRESRLLARRIKETQHSFPLATTTSLAEIARQALKDHRKIDPATRVFQALRIAVNDELQSLSDSLPQAVELLKPEGRLVVISYHSLEDRIVKYFLRDSPWLKVLTRKPIRPTQEEVFLNPASRSAKLRAAVKLSRFDAA